MTTQQEKIEVIRQKCIPTNPDKFHPDDCHCGYEHDEKIRLADVLLVFNFLFSGEIGRLPYQVENNPLYVGWIRFEQKDLRAWHEMFWNLRTDDLTQQSDPTIDFLCNLLKVDDSLASLGK